MKIFLIFLAFATFLTAKIVNLSPITSTSTSTTVTYISSPSSGGGGGSSGGGGTTIPSNRRFQIQGPVYMGGGSGYTSYTPPTIHISIVDFEIFGEEDAKDGERMKFNIAFSRPLRNQLELSYEIVPNQIELAKDITNGAKGSIIVPSGSRSAYIYVDVVDDNLKEDAEYFTIKLSRPIGRYKLDTRESIGVIIDNDIEYDTNVTTGDYLIYEHGTTNSTIDTKIVNSPTKLDIYASSGFEVAHKQGMNSSKSCSAPVCTTSGNKKVCTKTCTTTITPYIEYSDKMDIDRVVMFRAKSYDPATKKCIDPKMLTLSRKKSFKSGDGPFSVDIPTDGAFRCAWIEVWGHSATDMNTHKSQILHGKSDVFAIRPKKFHIEKSSSPITAANTFDLKIEAEDIAGNPAKYYNQKQDQTFKVDISDKIYGTVDLAKNGFILSGYDFLDGKLTKSIKYNEVGEIEVKISENPSNYYAIVDASNSFIEPASEVFTFIPANFEVSYDANQYKNSASFAFMANSYEMYSKLHLDIKALNADGDITKRYDKNGYANQTKVDFTQYINQTDKKDLSYQAGLTDTTTQIDITPKVLSVSFALGVFQNGQMLEDIKESFKRVANQPQNPIELTTTRVDIEDTKYSSVKGSKSITSSSKHYFGRVHVAPDPVLAEGTNLDANIYYEVYCKGCDKTKFSLANNKASVDSVYWYIIPKSEYLGKNICEVDGSSVDVVNHDANIKSIAEIEPTSSIDPHINVKISIAPYANRVIYRPTYSYLLYDRIDPAITTHKFDIKFTNAGGNWAGEGVKGTTVDIDISDKANTSIEW